jgi:ribonuclease HI
MSGINWKKNADRQRMQRQGVEDRAATSKDALRREADRLLAGYSGPVTKVPAGIRVTGSQVTGEIPSERASGNVAISVTGHVASEKFRAAGKARKSKGRRPQKDLFGTARKSVPSPTHIGRAVPPGLVIYCDGACEPNPGIGGWGFVVYRDGKEIHADCGGANPTTNNVMELTGALRALEWIAEHLGERQDGVHLFCDSMYVVNGCNEWRHGWKRKGWQRGGSNAKPENRTIANLDLWQTLDRALTRTPIVLEWCKGHVGIIGNERADELSLEGRESILALQPDPLDLIREQLDYSARGGW